MTPTSAAAVRLAPISGLVRARLDADRHTDDICGYGRIVGPMSSRGYPAAAAVRAYSPPTTHPL